VIIQSLYEYYDRLTSDPTSGVAPDNYSKAKVSFAFNLSATGELLDIFPLYETQGKKKIAREMLVPEQYVRTGNIKPNFLCGNSSYVLGLDNNNTPKRNEEAFVSFRDLHRRILGELEDEGSKAIIAFLDSREAGQADEEVIQATLNLLLKGEKIVFMLDGNSGYLHERPLLKKAWAQYKESEIGNIYVGQCLITGKNAPIARIHPQIKGISMKLTSTNKNPIQTKGLIASFNDDAYVSYGKKQSYNAPVSVNAAFAYTTALNYLLARKKNQLQIGDATTVFWADREEEENLIAAFFDPPEEEEDLENSIDYTSTQKVKDILLQLRDGRKPTNAEIDERTHFCILGLVAPNEARISIRYYYEGEFGSLMENIGRHYADMAIVSPKDYPHPLPAIWRILRETSTLGNSENIPSILSGAIMRAVLSGGAYPGSLYTSLISRIRADQSKKDKTGKPINNINPIRAGMIKACLIRQARIYGQKEKEEMITMSLNEESTNPGYVLGRLFALLEKAQKEASEVKLNATIKDRYFGAASATPASVFPILLRLSQHHISKAKYGYAMTGKYRKF